MEYIIRNVKILYGENLELIEESAIWVKNGEIFKIISEKEVPKMLSKIDGGGKYLLPGLIDLHVHLMWDGSIDPVHTLTNEGYEQMLIRAVSYTQDYIKHGITTVRDIGSVDDIAIHVARAINRKLVKGPRIIASGKTLTMTGGHDPFWARFVDGKDEALKGVREQIYKGAGVIKVSSTGGVYGRTEGEAVGNVELSREEQEVICNEAHKFGLRVASHAIGREGILNSILAGVDTIEHGHFLDDELIQLMEEKNAAWIPTLYVYKQIAEQEGIPSYAKEKAYNIVKRHTKAFQKYFSGGVIIGAGSDAGSPSTPHPSLLQELLSMNSLVKDIKSILKTATVNAGIILDKKLGQVKSGYEADFILLSKNPLDNLENLQSVDNVFIKGEKVR